MLGVAWGCLGPPKPEGVDPLSLRAIGAALLLLDRAPDTAFSMVSFLVLSRGPGSGAIPKSTTAPY